MTFCNNLFCFLIFLCAVEVPGRFFSWFSFCVFSRWNHLHQLFHCHSFVHWSSLAIWLGHFICFKFDMIMMIIIIIMLSLWFDQEAGSVCVCSFSFPCCTSGDNLTGLKNQPIYILSYFSLNLISYYSWFDLIIFQLSALPRLETLAPLSLRDLHNLSSLELASCRWSSSLSFICLETDPEGTVQLSKTHFVYWICYWVTGRSYYFIMVAFLPLSINN